MTSNASAEGNTTGNSDIDDILSTLLSDDYICSTTDMEDNTVCVIPQVTPAVKRYQELEDYLLTLPVTIEVGVKTILQNRFNYPNNFANIVLNIQKVGIALSKNVIIYLELKK